MALQIVKLLLKFVRVAPIIIAFQVSRVFTFCHAQQVNKISSTTYIFLLKKKLNELRVMLLIFQDDFAGFVFRAVVGNN